MTGEKKNCFLSVMRLSKGPHYKKPAFRLFIMEP